VILAWVLLGALALQRLAELAVARRHAQRLFAAGAVLVRDDAYGRIVAVHAAFFGGFAAEALLAPWSGTGWWTVPALLVFAAGQGLRLWTMRTLGDRWTTRVVVLPGRARIEHGPFRLLRHPNYVGVGLELAALPLAFGLPLTAVAASLLNVLALGARIRCEEAALERAAPAGAEPSSA